jgi:tellurite resistance protein
MSNSKPCCPDLNCADPERVLNISTRDQVQLVVEIGLVAAMLDDAIPDGESEALVTAIRLLPGLKDTTENQINELLARAGERTRRGDAWLCEVAHGLRHPGLRRVAFRMAALFCSWDGVIDEKEQGFLNWLAKTFELTDDDAMRLFHEATGQALDSLSHEPRRHSATPEPVEAST